MGGPGGAGTMTICVQTPTALSPSTAAGPGIDPSSQLIFTRLPLTLSTPLDSTVPAALPLSVNDVLASMVTVVPLMVRVPDASMVMLPVHLIVIALVAESILTLLLFLSETVTPALDG